MARQDRPQVLPAPPSPTSRGTSLSSPGKNQPSIRGPAVTWGKMVLKTEEEDGESGPGLGAQVGVSVSLGQCMKPCAHGFTAFREE